MTPLERTALRHLIPAPSGEGGREPDGLYEIRTTGDVLLWDSGLRAMRALPLPDDLDMLGEVDSFEEWFATWTSVSVHLEDVEAIDATKGKGNPVAMWLRTSAGQRIGHTEPIVAIHRVTLPEPLLSVDTEPDLTADLGRRVQRTIVVSTDRSEVVIIETGKHIDSFALVAYVAPRRRRAAWHNTNHAMWRWSSPVVGKRWSFHCDVDDSLDTKRSTVGAVTCVRVLAGL